MRGEGQEEAEDRAAVGGVLAAAKEETSSMAIDDFVADPEAEAGAVDSFGGEEGLEDAGAGRWSDASTGIGHGKSEAAAAGAPVCGLATA